MKKGAEKGRYWIGMVFLLLFLSTARGQEPQEPEQALENLAERSGGESLETEPSEFQYEFLTSHPLDLNRVNGQELLQLGLLNKTQVDNLIRYRKVLGNFISVYEIQAVPGMDLPSLHRLLPYIIVSGAREISNGWQRGLLKPENFLLARVSRVLELSRGYREKDSTGHYHYPGSPEQVLIRYRYAIKNKLQIGFLAEKDAGEQFGRGFQRQGFDFYSFHCALQLKGLIRQMVWGDFTINMGQGLIQWQSLAFSKSPDLAMLTRQSPTIRTYQSSGENQFHRGMAISLGKKTIEANLFLAHDGIDASLELDSAGQKTFTGIQSSGYHRTLAEQQDKNALQQWVFGGNLVANWQKGHIGLNLIRYDFNGLIEKQRLPYNLYALSGKRWSNCSLDYGFNFHQLRLFGEWAVDGRGGWGAISGLLMTPDPSIDLGILYRHLGPKFRSIDGNAFTESSDPSNENGVWVGITARPVRRLRLEVFADFFTFPWLKYRVDGPSNGVEYLLQTDYGPAKRLEIGFRLRWKNKPGNDSFLTAMHALVQARQLNLRSQFKYDISVNWTVRSRLELVGYQLEGTKKESGFMTNLDILFHPSGLRWSANSRLEWFETDGYGSRIYAFENDVPYYYYVPALFNRGLRTCLNLKISYGAQLSMGLKWAQTLYNEAHSVGSGWDEIKGQKRSELRIELLIKF